MAGGVCEDGRGGRGEGVSGKEAVECYRACCWRVDEDRALRSEGQPGVMCSDSKWGGCWSHPPSRQSWLVLGMMPVHGLHDEPP